MARAQVVHVFEREWLVWRRLWRASVFSYFLVPILFLAGMGLGLGDLVQHGSGKVEGLTYLEFVTPGLLAASVVFMGAGESLWPVMMGTKWMRTYHAAVSTPLTADDVFVGHILWIAFRTALAATVFLVVGALLGGVPSAWGVLAIPAAVLGGLALATLLSAYSVTRDSDISFAPIMRLGVFPLFLFSATFFPLSQLPDWLQPVAVLSPLWHSVELCRMATTADVDWPAAVGHLAALAVFIGVGWRLGARNYRRALAQ